ncbi:MAG: TetR/AcrR family transcriptional regulator [Peptococcaceae bacterium]|jgi:TetR/AcrR family fatty acid metabolism transcriptional regulator|nr:TetR/AcrR family transcriptional regulator [Peptococcaceae bacterium]
MMSTTSKEYGSGAGSGTGDRSGAGSGAGRQKNRRDAIVRAAIESFSGKGFHETKIEEVAVAAGVGKGTVYEYFRSKEELLVAAAKYQMDETVQQALNAMDSQTTVRGKLNALVETVMGQRQSNCGQVNLNFSNMGQYVKEFKQTAQAETRRWREWMAEILRQGVESGEIRQVNVDIFLGALMGAITYIMRPWEEPPVMIYNTPSEAAARVVAFFFDGIGKNSPKP